MLERKGRDGWALEPFLFSFYTPPFRPDPPNHARILLMAGRSVRKPKYVLTMVLGHPAAEERITDNGCWPLGMRIISHFATMVEGNKGNRLLRSLIKVSKSFLCREETAREITAQTTFL